MNAFWMCKLAPTEISDSDAVPGHQRGSSQAWPDDRMSQVAQVSTKRRMLRVLVVDSEPDSASGFAKLVRHWRHAPQTAADGHSALRVAARQHPDVVLLLNLEMCFMDGYRFTRQLRGDFPRRECLIIAITNQAGREQRKKCDEAGIDLVLISPIDALVLQTLLMLEYAHVNRLRIDRPALARRDVLPIARKRPSSPARPSHLMAGMGADNKRHNRPGGSPC